MVGPIDLRTRRIGVLYGWYGILRNPFINKQWMGLRLHWCLGVNRILWDTRKTRGILEVNKYQKDMSCMGGVAGVPNSGIKKGEGKRRF